MSSVLSLGSNVGDRWANLRLGVQVLEPLDVSPVYETLPWGNLDQETFLNLVVLCEWDAAEAWRRAVRAEELAGRVRGEKWGPRSLDVDVIQADGTDPALVLPHPHAHERAFVLVPWLDLDPDAELQGFGPIGDLPIDRSGVFLAGELE
jgi:2-amino-4-hydroxy-6-hydroxymethyldihydropteridine diphosphokinase